MEFPQEICHQTEGKEEILMCSLAGNRDLVSILGNIHQHIDLISSCRLHIFDSRRETQTPIMYRSVSRTQLCHQLPLRLAPQGAGSWPAEKTCFWFALECRKGY